MDQAAYSNAVFYITGLDKRYRVNKRVGWVYAAHNARMGRSVFKIGMSSRPPTERAGELEQFTGYEGTFRLVNFVHVADRVQAEKWVHRTLDRHRIRSWEEFFDVPLKQLATTLDEAAGRFPLYMGLPERYSGKVKGAAPLLPQAFRRWRLACPSCAKVNDVREFGVPMTVNCRACGHRLLPG